MEPTESQPNPYIEFLKTLRWKMLLWVAICTVGVLALGAPYWAALVFAIWLLYQEQ